MSKLWHIVRFFLTLALAVLVVDITAVLGFAFLQPQGFIADDAVVLGAAINSPALTNRSLEALDLYQKGQVKELVLSGGRISDKDITEAADMKKIILQHTSSTPPIILDDTSRTTYENVRNTKNLIGTGKSIVIVSDSYHLARGVLLAWRAGYKTVYWTSPDTDSYTPLPELAFHFVREMAAIVSYIPKFIWG